MDVALVPEATQLVPEVENRLDLFLTDPLGAPFKGLGATVSFPDGTSVDVTTDEMGLRSGALDPARWHRERKRCCPHNASLKASRSPAPSNSVSRPVMSTLWCAPTRRSIRPVDTVEVEIQTSGSGWIYVDWINSGQTVDMRTLQTDDGVVRLIMPLDSALMGSNRVEGYVVGRQMAT